MDFYDLNLAVIRKQINVALQKHCRITRKINLKIKSLRVSFKIRVIENPRLYYCYNIITKRFLFKL